MSRTTIRLANEKTLRTVVNRAYVIEGRGAEVLRKRAEEALLKTNPALARKEGFKPGATVVIPRVPGLTLRDPPRRGGGSRGRDLGVVLHHASDQVRSAQVSMERLDREADERAEAAQARLKNSEFQKLLKSQLPDKVELLKAAASGIAERQEQSKARHRDFARALGQVAEALDDLAKRARTPRPG